MAHRILLEGCQLTLSQGTGIATYARSLANAIQANGHRVDLLIDTDKPITGRDHVLDAISLFDATVPDAWGPMRRWARRKFGAPGGIRAFGVSFDGVVADQLTKSFRSFAHVLAATDLDRLMRHHFLRYGRRATVKVKETPSLFHASQPIAIAVKNCPNIYTIHDIIPLILPNTTREDKKYMLNMLRHLCQKADHIVTVSEFSRQEIIRFFGIQDHRITNTYQSINLPVKTLSQDTKKTTDILENAFGLTHNEYFLFVGAIEPKKNLSRLIDAYAVSGSKYPLVTVGGLGWQFEGELEKIADDRFLRYEISENAITSRRQVRRLPYVSAEHLVALMRGARALLFPSLYEGFGLPVLEAMSLGTPVMTSNTASLPEVAGDAAILVDPLDVEDMARAIRALDCDGDLRSELRARGLKRAELFSPENYQKRIADLYRRIIG